MDDRQRPDAAIPVPTADRPGADDWRRILDAVNDCVWSADLRPDGAWSYRYVSPAVERITGRPATYFLSGRAAWLDIVHPDDRARVAASDEALPFGQRNASGAEYCFRVFRIDGAVRWVRDFVRLSSSGGPVRLDGVLSDVTPQHEAERALRASEDRMRRVVDSSPHAIVLVSAENRINLANLAAERLFGRTRGQLVGQSWLEIGLVEDFEASKRSIIQGRHFTVDRPDGTAARVITNLARLRGASGQFEGMVVSLEDVTAVADASEKLAKSEAQARLLLEQLPAIVWSTDAALQFTSCQGRGLVGLGLRSDDIVGRSLGEILDDGSPHPASVDAHREALAGGSTNYDCELRGRSLSVHVEPLRGAESRVEGVIGIGLDVTAQRQLETQLRHAAHLEAIGQLAGGIAHDFNNLLTAILGNLSLALAQIPIEAPARGMLAAAEQAAWRAAELTGQLLGFARQRAVDLQACDLNAVVREVAGLFAHALDPRIELTLELTGGIGVRADAGQIHQVIVNLCVNARDAMPEGGRLTLAAAVASVDRPPIRGVESGRYARLSVRDTGCGIPPDTVERIFEPFFTTKGPGRGTGLGLSTALGIVRQHGGWIACDSTPLRGTRFDVFLPLVDAGVEFAASVQPVTVASAGRGEAILVVDDEAIIRQLVRAILEDAGYAVVEAADGLAALDLVAAASPPISLVLLDIMMPRLSGRDTRGRLATLDPTLRILYSSGYTANSLSERDIAEVSGIVEKPYRVADLLEAVRRALDGPPPPSPLSK